MIFFLYTVYFGGFFEHFSRTNNNKTQHLNISIVIKIDIGIQKRIPRYSPTVVCVSNGT